MGYCLYRPQPFEAGPGAESVRSVADSCWSRIKGRDKVELKLGCGNYDPQTPPSTLDSISLKDYPNRLLGCMKSRNFNLRLDFLLDVVDPINDSTNNRRHEEAIEKTV